MVARRVSCSTLPLWRPLSLGPLTHSPFAGASSRALFVSAHSMRHMLAFPLTLASSSGTLAASVHLVSQLHSGTPLLLAGDSNIWFPFFQLGRSRQADAPLLPIDTGDLAVSFPGISELPSSSNPPLWCCSGHHSLFAFFLSLRHCPLGFELLSPCALCCPLLSSDHMLCSCRLDISQLLCVSFSAHSPLPRVHDWSTVIAACQHSLSVCTSPSWPTSLAHSLTFLSVLPFWTLSLTLSRGSSVAVLRITLVVAAGPAHAQASLSGGMMRATTLWLLATAHGVIFAALGLLRIRLVSASSVNSFTAQFVPPGPGSGTSGLVL